MAAASRGAPLRGAVIFLHGSGDSGPGIEAWVDSVRPGFLRALRKANVKVVFPSAPPRPYAMMGGAKSTVWFDRWSLALDAREDPAGLEDTARALRRTVSELERDHGVPASRVVLGGFSMGGGTSLFCGLLTPFAPEPAAATAAAATAAVAFASSLESDVPASGVPASDVAASGAERRPAELAGVFSLSSWVTSASALWPALDRAAAHPGSRRPLPPVFLAHGDGDRMIDPAWGEATAARLGRCPALGPAVALDGQAGASRGVSWFLEKGVGHEPGPLALEQLEAWLLDVALPV